MKKFLSIMAGVVTLGVALIFSADASPLEYFQYVRSLDDVPTVTTRTVTPRAVRVNTGATNMRGRSTTMQMLQARYKRDSRVTLASTKPTNYVNKSLPYRPASESIVSPKLPVPQEYLQQFATGKPTWKMTDSGPKRFVQFVSNAVSFALPEGYATGGSNTFSKAGDNFTFMVAEIPQPCGDAKFDSCVEKLWGQFIREQDFSLTEVQMVTNQKYYGYHYNGYTNVQGAVKLRSFINARKGLFHAWYAVADTDGDIFVVLMTSPVDEVGSYVEAGKHITDTLQIHTVVPGYVEHAMEKGIETDVEARGFVVVDPA